MVHGKEIIAQIKQLRKLREEEGGHNLARRLAEEESQRLLCKIEDPPPMEQP